MTVQYYQEVLSAGPVAFLKLLFKWRGGIFKLIYMDFLVFSSLYAIISCIYRFILKENMKKHFEKVVLYVQHSQSLIPVAFILGFYVTLVFGRFWTHFNTVPWITKVALLVACHLRAGPHDVDDSEACLERKSIIRYLVAAQILTLNRVSASVKRRFRKMSDLYSTGFLLEHEACMINNTEPCTMQPFIPITWCASIVMHANSLGRITNESVLINIIKEINNFRRGLQELFLLDQVNVPLVYTQVVTLAVYTYFLSCLIGSQFIMDGLTSVDKKDFFVPIFTILQFIVYMGWLKLALTLVNPMGEDDEDFDLNSIIDYNIEVGLAIVDHLNDKQPPFARDKFFNQKHFDLPMESSMKDSKCKPFMGSVFDLKLGNDNLRTSLRSVMVGENDDNRSWADDGEVRDKLPVRKGSLKHQYSNRKASGNSLFHFNPIPSLSEEDLSGRGDLEVESPITDAVVPKSPKMDVKIDKRLLVAIEEEDTSPSVDLETHSAKQKLDMRHKLSSVKEDPLSSSELLEMESQLQDSSVVGESKTICDDNILLTEEEDSEDKPDRYTTIC